MQPLALMILLGPALMLSITTAQGTYYVKPDGVAGYDCHDYMDCRTFDEYVEETSQFFTPRSIFIFMAGSYSLHNELILNGTSDVLFKGQGSADTVCRLTHSIVFANVFNITLSGLTFLLHNYEHNRESALFVDSSDVTIANVIFLGSGDETVPLAQAVRSIYSNVFIMDSVFRGKTGSDGGAI